MEEILGLLPHPLFCKSLDRPVNSGSALTSEATICCGPVIADSYKYVGIRERKDRRERGNQLGFASHFNSSLKYQFPNQL
jgi:hypothetical protein